MDGFGCEIEMLDGSREVLEKNLLKETTKGGGDNE